MLSFDTEQKAARERIVAAVKKRNYRFIREVKDRIGRVEFLVVWYDARSKKSKIGTLSENYYHLYGPDVLAATSEQARVWFKSNSVMSSFSQEDLDLLVKFATDPGSREELPCFDVTKFKTIIL